MNVLKLGDPLYTPSQASMSEDLYENLEPEFRQPVFNDSPVILVTDASKTNSCSLVVGLDGEVIDAIAVSGNDRKYYNSPMEDHVYIRQLREYLTSRYKLLSFAAVAQEEVLGNNMQNSKTGAWKGKMATQKTLTALREAFVEVGATLWNDQAPLEINNGTWKAHTIPREFNVKDGKGSLLWLSHLYPRFPWNGEDDFTDALLLAKYILLGLRGELRVGPDGKTSNTVVTKAEKILFGLGNNIPDKAVAVEGMTVPYQAMITDPSAYPNVPAKLFEYNYDLTFEQNLNYIMNHNPMLCRARVDVDKLPLDIIYKYSTGCTVGTDHYIYCMPSTKK